MFRHQPPAAMFMPLSKLGTAFARSGNCVGRFESELASYLGVRACFTAASARAALYQLLTVLSVERPQRTTILLPAYTCPVLVKVILDVGLRPLTIDISPDTFTFDMAQFAQHLNETVLAVIHVHPFGIPLPVAEVLAQAHAVGVVVIEDAAQAMGAKLNGQQVGTLGDFGLFSLGPGKPLSVGGGGVLSTNDEAYARKLAVAWKNLPQATVPASVWALLRLVIVRLATGPHGWWLAAKTGIQKWGESEDSWSYKIRQLTPVQARVGRALLAELDELNELRRENGRQIQTGLQGLDFLQGVEGGEPIYLRLPLLLDTAEQRERLINKLSEVNITAGRLYRHPLPDIFPQADTPPYPGAAEIAQRLLTLPTHHYMSQDDIGRMLAVIRSDSPRFVKNK